MKALLREGDLLEGRYQVGKAIAKGGFAVVYAGRDLQQQRPVAIKALRTDADDFDAVASQRFVQEAAVALRLQHPNIVHTLACGQSPDGIPFIVMEHLLGQTLAKTIYEAPTPPERVFVFLEQMLTALEVAHGAGVVHRDLKPSNVFVCAQPPSLLYKILDFGFVKVLDSRETPLTLQGQRVGTPGYMAPELMTEGVVSPAVDLYALGILAHELLTARPAFAGKGIERAFAQLQGGPQPAPEEIQASPLYKVVADLLHSAPGQRPPSAAAARERLQAAAATPRPVKRWWHGWRRH